MVLKRFLVAAALALLPFAEVGADSNARVLFAPESVDSPAPEGTFVLPSGAELTYAQLFRDCAKWQTTDLVLYRPHTRECVPAHRASPLERPDVLNASDFVGVVVFDTYTRTTCEPGRCPVVNPVQVALQYADGFESD